MLSKLYERNIKGYSKWLLENNLDFFQKISHPVKLKPLSSIRAIDSLKSEYKKDGDNRDLKLKALNHILGETVEDYFVDNGFILNSFPHDYANPHQYAFDVICPKTGIRIEIKAHRSKSSISFRLDNSVRSELGNNSVYKISQPHIDLTGCVREQIADVIVFCYYTNISKNEIVIKPSLIIDNHFSIISDLANKSYSENKIVEGILYHAPYYIGFNSQNLNDKRGVDYIQIL